MTKLEWHRADNGSTLLYTLRQDGWRKGQPIMINDVMIRIEKTNGSETDLEPIIKQVLSALNGHSDTKPVEAVPFQSLAYGARFRYEPDAETIWCKIGRDLIAEWDADKVSDNWTGQALCSFRHDDLSDLVYLVEGVHD